MIYILNSSGFIIRQLPMPVIPPGFNPGESNTVVMDVDLPPGTEWAPRDLVTALEFLQWLGADAVPILTAAHQGNPVALLAKTYFDVAASGGGISRSSSTTIEFLNKLVAMGWLTRNKVDDFLT
jgi:hypothetical protein